MEKRIRDVQYMDVEKSCIACVEMDEIYDFMVIFVWIIRSHSNPCIGMRKLQ